MHPSNDGADYLSIFSAVPSSDLPTDASTLPLFRAVNTGGGHGCLSEAETVSTPLIFVQGFWI